MLSFAPSVLAEPHSCLIPSLALGMEVAPGWGTGALLGLLETPTPQDFLGRKQRVLV